MQTQSIRTETGVVPTRFTAAQPSCEASHRNPLATATLVCVEERGQPSNFCEHKDVRQSSLRSDDARCSQDESYEEIKIFEVKGINRDEDYSSHNEAFVDKDGECSNGGSSYEDRKGDQFKVKPSNKFEQDVLDPRSLRTADLYALIEATEGLDNIQKESSSNLLKKYIKHMIAKFRHPYEGPYIITKIVPPSAYEISDSKGKLRGMFNKQLLKPYFERIDVG